MMNKRMLGLIISFLMVIAVLVACSNTEENPNNGGTSKNSNNTENTNETDGSDEVVTLDLFVDQSWWPLKDWSGPIPEEITKRTGVKLNITVASDEQQLPIMIASKSFPDLVVTNLQFERMSDAELSYDWQSLIDQYVPEFEIDQERIA